MKRGAGPKTVRGRFERWMRRICGCSKDELAMFTKMEGREYADDDVRHDYRAYLAGYKAGKRGAGRGCR